MRLNLFIGALIVVLLGACKTSEVIQYNYSTTTMMGRTQVSVNQDSVVVVVQGRMKVPRFARKTETSEWQGLMKAMENVNLKKIATLEAPSSNRQTDASPYAQFELTTKDSTYVSASFDGGNPHEMLSALMEEFKQIIDRNKALQGK